MRGGLFNIIGILFFVGTVAAIAFVGLQLINEPEETPVPQAPTEFVLPTSTPVPPTETPRPTLPPTFTPIPSNTPTFTPSVPPTATPLPTSTITDTPGPTLTPSESPTLSDTLTPTTTDTPSGPMATRPPTESPFFFDIRDSVVYSINSFNTAGCAWQGIGGQVVDANGFEIVGRQFQVHVLGTNFDVVTTTGSNSLYGPITGWEVPVSNQVSSTAYFVRLETLSGTQISPDIPIQFPGNCNQNLAQVRFYQMRGFGQP